MIKNNEIKRVFISGTFILLFLAGVFIIAKTQAQGSSADLRLPATNEQTQTEIHAGGTQGITGTLNNGSDPNTSQCGSLGQYYAVRNFSQNSSNSFVTVYYWEFETWEGALVDTTRHDVSDWLENPPSYDLVCWRNEPQVRWRESP